MIKRLAYYTVPLFVAGVLSLFASCQEEETFGSQSAENGRLMARKTAAVEVSRAGNNTYFNERVRYRLWAYHTNTDKYMFDEGVTPRPNGVLAQESSGHYVWFDQSNAKLLRDNFKVYGFTDGKVYEDTEAAVQDGSLFTPHGGDETRPTYTITYAYDEKTCPEGYPDYMRAYLSYNSAEGHDPVMEFKHIFSRVRVQVIQQGGKDDDATKGLYDLKLHIAKLEGVYDTEIFDVRGNDDQGGTFTVPDGESLKERQLRAVGEGLDIIPADAKDTPFSTSYVFPTITNVTLPNSTMHHRLKLYISGTDAATFTGETE